MYLWVFLVELEHLMASFLRYGYSLEVNQHRQTYTVNKLQPLITAILIRRLELVVPLQQDVIPQNERILESKLPGMDAPDPPQQKGSHLHLK